jgi:hypothetical protein
MHMEAPDKHTMLFARLVLMLHAAPMQYLGKIKNPVTDSIERDLAGAQGMIDTLEMLQTRTKGNLSQDEARMLTQMLQELRLNYVDEAQKPAAAPAKDGGATA